jgi:hypothetical protein
LAIDNIEDPVINVNRFKNSLNPVSLGICNKHLPETILTHQPDQLLHPVIIQFIKDIVEE